MPAYKLLFNGLLTADEGIGYAICFDKIINVSGDSNLCFRPLEAKITAKMHIVRQRYQVLPKPAEMFLQKLREMPPLKKLIEHICAKFTK